MFENCSRLVAVVAVVFLAACGGSDSPSEPGGNGGGNDGSGGGMTRQIEANPSFADHIQEIFVRNGCTSAGCHGDGTGAGLMLVGNSSSNHGALVGVPSTSEPGFLRVESGDATNSYLVIKVEGRQNVGGRMPAGGATLDNIDITNIRNWIDNGAMNN